MLADGNSPRSPEESHQEDMCASLPIGQVEVADC